MRRAGGPSAAALALLLVTVGTAGSLAGGSAPAGIARAGQAPTPGEIQVVPEVADGFGIQPLAVSPGVTALAFGPGQDLYAATIPGQVLRYDVAWTETAPVVQGVAVEAAGFNLPLGVTLDDEGDLYVADVREAGEDGADGEEGVDRPMGRVTEIDADTGNRAVIVDGLPNGAHNTNHLRFGPDGRLYIPNGASNDHGNGSAGENDVFPYSGAFLAVDVNGVDGDQPDTTPQNPAILNWRDADGDRIADENVSDHPLNEKFARQVDVFAFGFRNIFGVTFAPEPLPFAGDVFTAMNGASIEAVSQDVVYNVEEDAHHGFPFCYDRGEPGATGDAITKVPNPLSPNPDFPCDDKPTADAMIGWHVAATGVDFPEPDSEVAVNATFPDRFASSLFVGEAGPLSAVSLVNKTARNPTTHNTGHKVARVPVDAGGNPTGVRDFLTGLQSPTDVQFGPDGAMYVADATVVHRVFPTSALAQPEPPASAAAGPSLVPASVVAPGAASPS